MYSWVSLSRRAGEPEDEEERDPTAVAAAIAKLNQLYDSGKPLFTRESILYIHEQIKNPKNPLVRGDTISVIALDGVKVDFNVDIGNVTPTYRDED
jgi:predicted transglutaminase-like protease